MYMIEIIALDNGAHRNQTYHGVLPDGWCIVREDVSQLENFPFGEVEAQEINGQMTMTKWTPGTMPEQEPVPDPEPNTAEILNAMLGVTTNE